MQETTPEQEIQPTQEEITKAAEFLHGLIRENMELFPKIAALKSGERVKFSSISAVFKLIGSLGKRHWRGNAGNFVKWSFRIVSIICKLAFSPREINKIRTEKQKELEERAKISLPGREKINTKVGFLRAALKLVKKRVQAELEEQAKPYIEALKANPEAILTNPSFQKLITDPALIKLLNDNASIFAKVIKAQLSKILFKEEKVVSHLLSLMQPPSLQASSTKKGTDVHSQEERELFSSKAKQAVFDIIDQLQKNGALVAITSVVTAAQGDLTQYLANEGGAQHLKRILEASKIALPEPEKGVELIGKLTSEILAKFDQPGMPRDLMNKVALLTSDVKELKKREFGPAIDKGAIAAELIQQVLPIIDSALPILQTNSEWIRETARQNLQIIVPLASDAFTKVLNGAMLDPMELSAFLNEIIPNVVNGVIKPESLEKIGNILKHIPTILDSRSSKLAKASAALEIGELICQLLEDPSMSVALTGLSNHSAFLVAVLTPVIGEYVEIEKLINIISNDEGRKDFIASFRKLKRGFDKSDTKLGKWAEIVIGARAFIQLGATVKLTGLIKAFFKSKKDKAQAAAKASINKEAITKPLASETSAVAGQSLSKFVSETPTEASHTPEVLNSREQNQQCPKVASKPQSLAEKMEISVKSDKEKDIEKARKKVDAMTLKVAAREAVLARATSEVNAAANEAEGAQRDLEAVRMREKEARAAIVKTDPSTIQKAKAEGENVGVFTNSANAKAKALKEARNGQKKAQERLTEAKADLKNAEAKVLDLEKNTTVLEGFVQVLKKVGAKEETESHSPPKAPKRPTTPEAGTAPPTLAH